MAQRTSAADDSVLAYLGRVLDTSAVLCLPPGQETIPDTPRATSGDALVREIAGNLLRASDPQLIITPLPAPLVKLEEEKEKATERIPSLMDPEDEKERIPDWETTRSDYLRCLLRGMSPIALDVAAQICSELVARMSNDSIPQASAAAALVLFSKWLPIAPQLAPLVSELFALEMFPCPLEYGAGHDRLQLIVAEAAHAVYDVYAQRNDHSSMKSWWPWGHLFTMLMKDTDVVMKDGDYDLREAIRWHAARAIGYLIHLQPAAFAEYLERLNVRTARVAWVPHPWMIGREEERAQFRYLRGRVSLLDCERDEVEAVTAEQVRRCVPLHSLLVHVGEGIVLVKNHAVSQLTTTNDAMQDEASRRKKMILTPTTAKNFALLGAAMCTDPYPLPILVCGPAGSGKSSLVRELAHYCCASNDDLLEIHVDEETDSKTLIGSYTTTDVPGEFTWRPGALTQAVKLGKWVLMEDVDTVPTEIQAAIVQLLEDRALPLGGGKFQRCHPKFRLFGTCTTNPDSNQEASTLRLSGKRLLNPSLWRKVHVQPLAFSELKQVGESLHPSLPPVVIEAALGVLKALDKSGRLDTSGSENIDAKPPVEAVVIPASQYALTSGRHASVRDFLKLLSRISHTVLFEHNTSYVTEAQRTLCLAETFDVFAASCPSLDQRNAFITLIAAPLWGITGELALNYIDARQPSISHGPNYTEIGRAKISNACHERPDNLTADKFATTNFSLRLMESIGVCVTENEPTLLVGETGCGKTATLQQLAKCAGRDLIVQNLSLQTDSTDLLGGYRPLEIPHIARKVYLEFVDIFVATFSRKQNADFLNYAASVFRKKQWKKLAGCFSRAASLGLAKIKERSADGRHVDASIPSPEAWASFRERAKEFERQRLACDSGLVFAFTEGALVDAIRTGKWVLLDEINLASSETLQRLCGLLDDSTGSVTLTERGDSHALQRHPDFRLFAAMNPATDAGKKDLPPSIRARFSELYVDELLDTVELRTVAARYLQGVVSTHDASLECMETAGRAVEIYLRCRDLAEKRLIDASGHKPRYTMRTLCRALSATRNLVVHQKLSLNRSMLEGFELAFVGALDASSTEAVQRILYSHFAKNLSRNEMDHPPRRPSSGRGGEQHYVLVKPFWLKAGPLDPLDWSEGTVPGRSKFILTESMSRNLRRLSRAVAAGPWPVLLEGPTSAGKTTLVEYLAARCGHEVVRINNHEHTDVQEYTGGYSSDANGSLSFQDGILVRALRLGHWVILDELNLAPSEVLEALNRLLDDNRELYLPEIDETVKPHPNFRLFATQNPSGAYGGRKPLSRAFRNRFVELHMGDIPAEEMKIILEKRCLCPPSHAKSLVKIMVALRQRRNSHGVFLGKDGLITPRDLLRWAERGGSSKLALAHEGYMLLAERLRSADERNIVKEEIESHLGVVIDVQEIYYGDKSEARTLLSKLPLTHIAPTKSLLRLLTLVMRCVRQKEPVLLVGETGCGKTTVVELLQEILDRELHTINCHATTETSDLIGGLRPMRGRGQIIEQIYRKLREFISLYPDKAVLESMSLPEFSLYVDETNTFGNAGLPGDAVPTMLILVEMLWESLIETPELISSISERYSDKEAKKRKLDSGAPLGVQLECKMDDALVPRLNGIVDDIKALARSLTCIFEWEDGPLVRAMRCGHLVLLDEMSLADDAVLERLNSLLEPSRTLVLAEKSTAAVDGRDGSTVVGHEDFRIFATMNPGGDFGKRELSPALRSRFTEIWVPQVTDPADIEMVLGRSLSSVATRCDGEVLKGKILNYVNFFNDNICGDKTSPCADLALSLRDVLAWARFVVDVSNSNEDMDPWALYCHGACLMHLDGLGLGTGLSEDDANNTKRRAVSFLLAEVPYEARPACEASFSINSRRNLTIAQTTGNRFGISPFTIETGNYPIPDSTFDFEAPTPSLNLLRVLRAMQVSKPILLEGSPGVGKTSLAVALAAASGHRLVRINLSEQTDMSDLMGSDLPNPDQVDTRSGNLDRSTGTTASFKWCDGVLLRAIKRGDWVLLDELNLASQSVLEGLNSCLDHRASVFIPELGKTFHCPPTFRIFAAQNPLVQGGGRKGLPKSFLNRFTKVYVESLTDNDLHSIVSSHFPSVESSLTRSMILFNKKVHTEVVECREYGGNGSPWEFNLRDVFRWCELVVANGDTNDEALARFAHHLYLQRFRNIEDRRRLDESYQEYFGVSLSALPCPEILITDQVVKIGGTALDRQVYSIDALTVPLLGEDSFIARTLLSPFEAVANCIIMRWPSLLVGVSGSGKSLLLRSLANLCNAPLIDVSLTPATDVNELVGTFEQVDRSEDGKRIVEYLGLLHDAACVYLTNSQEQLFLQKEISRLFCSIVESSPPKKIVAVALEIDKLLTASNVNREFQRYSKVHLHEFHVILRRVETASVCEKSHFRWVDGILVTAMKHGYWLHLENVNLCPASVLDRLNSIMEKEGELLLTECCVQDSALSGAEHLVVKQHPRFRIFLSMDPEHGEISRAMRNRCVEISLISSSVKGGLPVSPIEVVDRQDLLFATGVRSVQLSTSIIDIHRSEIERASDGTSEAPSTKALRECAKLFNGLYARGLGFQHSFTKSYRLSYEAGEQLIKYMSATSPLALRPVSGGLMPVPFLRRDWCFFPEQGSRDWQLRLARVFSSSVFATLESKGFFSSFLTELFGAVEPTDKNQWIFNVNGGSRLSAHWFSDLQSHLIALYLGKSTTLDLYSRSGALDGYNDAASDRLRFMASFLNKAVTLFSSPIHHCANEELCMIPASHPSLYNDNVLGIHLRRLSQLVREQCTYRRIACLGPQLLSTESLSALEVSWCLSKGRINRSFVTCSATPVLYPLFLAFDNWMSSFLAVPENRRGVASHVQQLERLLIQRDQLWLCLQQCAYGLTSRSNFLGFEDSGFIVQWTWLKKRLHKFVGLEVLFASAIQRPLTAKLKQQLDVLIEAIDRVLFNTTVGMQHSADVLWKKGGHPVVPRQAMQWEAVARLDSSSQDCCLLQNQSPCEAFGTDIVELHGLIHKSSPLLFINVEEKRELLAALCMCFWVSTDEYQGGAGLRLSFENQQISAIVSEDLKQKRQEFKARVRASQVDTDIATVENMIEIETLSSLRDCAGTRSSKVKDEDFLRFLLFRFAQIQVTPLAEFWCIQEEVELVETLAGILVTSQTAKNVVGNLKKLIPRLRGFVEVALSQTGVAVADLRPYQTLIWAIDESGNQAEPMRHLLQCLVPRMVNALSRHLWSNSFSNLEVISDELQMPSLWKTDETDKCKATKTKEVDAADFRQGPPGLNRCVKTELVFRLIGSDVSAAFNIARNPMYATIENHTARTKQARSILSILSTLEFPRRQRDPYQVQYLFAHVIEALIDFFPGGSGEEILSIIRDSDALQSVDEDDVCSLLAKCEYTAFRECLQSVVFPLFLSLRSISKSAMSQESQALCWIYVGLLRMNLLVLRSPLDPGKKPAAKVIEHSRYLETLEGTLMAMRLDSLFVRGVADPSDPHYRCLTEEVKWTKDKQLKQEQKRVERPSSAPPFIDLFRETQRFWKAATAPDGIPALVRAISEASRDKTKMHKAKVWERDWQATSGLFCSRVVGHFAPYEDVTLLFVNAVQNVRDGIRLLAEHHLSQNNGTMKVLRDTTFDSLLAFPCGNIFSQGGVDALISEDIGTQVPSGALSSNDQKRFRFALSLALLCRLDVQRRLRAGNLADIAVMNSHAVFASVASAWSLEQDGHPGTSEASESADALLEEEYREQFPDHGEAFQSLLHDIEVGQELDVNDMEQSEVPEEEWQFADDQIAVFCSLHKDLYSVGSKSVDDQSRVRSLCASYAAAYHLAQARPLVLSDSRNDIEQSGAHITLLGLCSNPNFGIIPFRLINEGDFHHDANPKEVAKANLPLDMLISRTSELLNAFPGHSVLIALVRVADHVRKFPLSTTSLGKAMHGLEIILRKAQEWEEHASSLVKLGTPLQDVSELVARWRKLELSSWGTLLDARSRRFALRARRSWPRLYNILVNGVTHNETCTPSLQHDWLVEAPGWVWKDLKTDMGTAFVTSSGCHEVGKALFDLSQLMDRFLLSSSLGEFKERMDLVETFASQLYLMTCHSELVQPWRAKVMRMLVALLSFYRQFVPILESKLSELRRPIESRLKDEVKLAKWDEQSYYALRDSTEKNHRRLMKLLREYDNVLELSVSSIMEREICHGIRSTEVSTEEPCSTIPSHKLLFPVMDQVNIDFVSVPTGSHSLTKEGRVWADPESAGLRCDKYVARMDHYARRVASLLQSHCNNGLSWSRVGMENVSTLCETIFERIESLRKENATKTMKQRALVDLFKSLKKNGFLQTKWCVPAQVREMVHLFQLPGLLNAGNALSSDEFEILEGVETYFQRTTAEVKRLQSEVLMLGSKHMSQRETQMMLSLAEHGLMLLCQQRCVLARMLAQVSGLAKVAGVSDNWEPLPLGQSKLRKAIKDFNDAYLSVTENLRQLQFLVKTASSLIEETAKADAVRDMISVVDSCITMMQGYRVTHLPQILTSSDISSVSQAGNLLEEVNRLICGCQQGCAKNHCLPTDVFGSCISEIQRARNITARLADEGSTCDPGQMVDVSSMMDGASLVVRKVLVGVQALCQGAVAESGEIAQPIVRCHSEASKEVAALGLDDVIEASSAVTDILRSIHESDTIPTVQRDCCSTVASGTNVLVQELLHVSRRRLVDYIVFSRSLAKLNYVLVRVFRVLIAKGYCADNISNGDDGDGEGGVGGMTFEDDQDGTGMGEGDGKQDVTDQLESEEQLLGLQNQDQGISPTDQQDSKELNEEEAKQGMEMEGDFEGDLFDVPDQSQEDEHHGDDDEELDREMGDGPDKNEDIIDEKMWDKSDDEAEHDPGEEKFEKDSGVKGETLENELRTREDDEKHNEGDASKDASNDTKTGENDNADTDETMHDQPEINQDSEEKYENKAGIDVREEQDADQESGDADDDDEPMKLEDDLNLDENDDSDTGEGGGLLEKEDPAVEDAVGKDDVVYDGFGPHDEDQGDSQSESNDANTELLEADGHKGEKKEEDEPLDELDEEMKQEVEFSGLDNSSQDVQGIQSRDGKDNVTETVDQDSEQVQDMDGKGKNDDSGNTNEVQPKASNGGTCGEGGDSGDQGEFVPDDGMDKETEGFVSVSNPFRSPGDASEFWHKKLRMLDKSTDEADEEMETRNGDNMDSNGDGEFEFASKDQANSTQVLGEADEDKAVHLDEQDKEHRDESHDSRQESTESPETKESSPEKRKSPSRTAGRKPSNEQRRGTDRAEQDVAETELDLDGESEGEEPEGSDDADDTLAANDDELRNQVVTDMSQLKVNDGHLVDRAPMTGSLVEDEGRKKITDTDIVESRKHWSMIQGETHHLARRLCEKLRLVMEPLVATKLKGDYRTGKRINMKRVIGYIASGYRKDKIWLRRTKPAKRNYRVLLAVDNSESMRKSGAGEMALAAMATLAVGMSQLEIGELGVASFGEEMRLLHPFHQPFTSESGVNVVQNFPFDEKRTRTALCVESAISVLESEGDASSMQLVFLISDGRIERDSRDALRCLVREMVERNILLVMIIVEGTRNKSTKKDSIVHMKEVTFKNGKPSVKQFIEDYPFPYYMVLEDMQSLPELLGGALSQWFEMLAQIQGSSR